MTHWMCVECGYLFSAPSPPNECPGCKEVCVFNDVTCYRPECGGEQNVDPLLVGTTLRTVTGVSVPPATRTAVSATTKARTAYVDTLATAEMFDGLTEEQKQQFLSLGKTETYERGVVIFSEGNEAQKLYIVEEGCVAIESDIDEQKRVPICTVSKGQVFGWSSLVPPYQLTASAIALEKTRALAIDGAKVRGLCSTNPTLGCIIMRNITRLVASRLKNLRLEFISLIYA